MDKESIGKIQEQLSQMAKDYCVPAALTHKLQYILGLAILDIFSEIEEHLAELMGKRQSRTSAKLDRVIGQIDFLAVEWKKDYEAILVRLQKLEKSVKQHDTEWAHNAVEIGNIRADIDRMRQTAGG